MEQGPNENFLRHYGIIRRSGRYPWGSGDNAYQSSKSFKAYLDEMRAQGLTNTQIAQAHGISTTELRDNITKASDIIRQENISMARRLKYEKQYSNRAIAKRMLGDENKESTVRGWLAGAEEFKENALENIAELLRGKLGTHRWLDVGKGTELYMKISDTRLRAAVSKLKDEGYQTWNVKLPQLGTDKPTEYKILGPADSTWKQAKDALLAGEVAIIAEKSNDGGLTFMQPKAEPISISSKRIEVVGSPKDGLIEVRRGVPELSLGANRYAQVRIAVDGTHYLKGMAIYSDDLPAGTDIRFNTTPTKAAKAASGSKLDAMKELDLRPEAKNNRFGASTVPMVYEDADGKEITSALNVVGYGSKANVEGAWEGWSNALSSQMLSKQSLNLASTQLAKAREQKQKTLDEIMAYTNPVVKKRLLEDFADSADAAAVHLKAAALPNQSTAVILPMTSMRPNEVYAPNLDDGTRVALVRHPHGGPFEIPQLTVNNKNTTARRIMGNARDAIGIHPDVAQQLSGADFDGDTVLVIPNNSNRVKSKPPLEELKGFEPEVMYPETPGMKYMTEKNLQREMGKISNLITDMTIKGAKTEEIAKAVKHSMVVIDAEKKKLNYKQSEKDNSIAYLKARYQSNPDNPSSRGASTIISRSSATARVPQFRPRRQSEGGKYNAETGEKEFVETGNTYVDKSGNVKPKLTKTTQGALAKDAYTLSSGEPMENVYAAHANALKAMANTARKEYLSIDDPPYSPAAKAYYAKEVESLKAKLRVAQMNAPLERRAQALGTVWAKARIENNPSLTPDQIKRVKYQSLQDARDQTGASKIRIGSERSPITEREWFAIQSGAVSSTVLKEILNNADMEVIKKLATPKYRSSLTSGQLALAKTMSNSGRTLAEISAALGIPRSTIADNLANA